jgi:RNA polymerase sigma-70 factor (ECF subfamily)
MRNTPDMTAELARAAAGDGEVWRAIVHSQQHRLRRMIVVRLDPRLMSRLDPDDVLQDVFLDAARQLTDYLQDPQIPFFLWLRLLTGHWIARAHRTHLGTRARQAGRDLSLDDAMPNASSVALAVQLLGREERPSQAARRTERVSQLHAALDEMDVTDREVLSLRHFEYLTRAEVAAVLGISEAAVSKRYVRALARLKTLLPDDLLDQEDL